MVVIRRSLAACAQCTAIAPCGDEKSSLVRYAIVIENAGANYSSCVLDLPGCIATDATVAEVEQAIREAIELHLQGMRQDGTPIPEPSSQIDYVEVAA